MYSPTSTIKHALTLSILSIFALLITPIARVDAQYTPFNFGGRLAWSMPCPCSLDYIIYVAPPPKPGVFSYRPGISRLNAYWNVFLPSVSMMGTYIPSPGACLMFTPFGCTPIGFYIGTVTGLPFAGMGTGAL